MQKVNENKLLGIDYGTKRIGIALSDDGGQMAFPKVVLENNADFLDALIALIESEGVGMVVIGESVDRIGEANSVQSAIESLIGDITLQVGIPVHLEPEQYTTQAALRYTEDGKKDAATTDAQAASLILESFINRQRGESTLESMKYGND